MKQYVRKFKEGVGYELVAKGSDRIVAQSKQVSIQAIKLADAIRGNQDPRKLRKIIEELKRWHSGILNEIRLLSEDIDNLEGFK
jgi:hypothetical protein